MWEGGGRLKKVPEKVASPCRRCGFGNRIPRFTTMSVAGAPALSTVQCALHLPGACSGPSPGQEPFSPETVWTTIQKDYQGWLPPGGARHSRGPRGSHNSTCAPQGLHPAGELRPKHAFYSSAEGRAVRKAVCCGGGGWWKQEKCQLPGPSLGPVLTASSEESSRSGQGT